MHLSKTVKIVAMLALLCLSNILTFAKVKAADFTIKESKIPISIVANQSNKLISLSNNKLLYEKSIVNTGSWEVISSDTYLFDLGSQTEKKIQSQTPSRKTVHGMYKNMVIYSCTNQLFLYDTNTDSQKLLATVPRWVGQVVIFGNHIAYISQPDAPNGQDSIPGPMGVQVYLYDLTTDTGKLIIEDTAVTDMALSDKYFAYSVSTYYNYVDSKDDIYVYDFSSGLTKKVLSDIKNLNTIALSNDTMVWDDGRNGKFNESSYVFENMDVYYYNIESQKSGPIVTAPGHQFRPSISGDKIVWYDQRNGQQNADIYMYDQSTKKETRITTDPNSQYSPMIDGNKIIWYDNRNAKEEFYLAELIYPVAQSTASKPKPIMKPTVILTSVIKSGVSSKPITLSSNSIVSLRKNLMYILSGTTSPNAKITLTIQSDPITQEVTANEKGEWTYTLNPKTLKLALGSHTISAYATDTAGIKGDSQELLKFTLKKPIEKPAATEEPYNYLNPINIASFIIILAGIGFLILQIVKKRKMNKQFSPKEENE